ncbi:MAG: CPC_1213 family protein [Bacillota bacterium]|nr:CPC_1213 family protein [Bacillota bacterium]
MNNKLKNTAENRKEDGKFKKRNIKHDPQAESSRAVFSARTVKDLD